MNIFKQFFNWVQSAPADFCYVTGEWDFKGNTSVKPTVSYNASRSANSHRSPAVVVMPEVPAFRAAYDDLLADLCIHNVPINAQESHAQV